MINIQNKFHPALLEKVEQSSSRPEKKLSKNVREKLKRVYARVLYLYNGVYTKRARSILDNGIGEFLDKKHRYAKCIGIFFDIWKESTATVGFEHWLEDLDQGKDVSGKEKLKEKNLIDSNGKPIFVPKVRYLSKDELPEYELQLDSEGRIFTKQIKDFHSPDRTKQNAYIFVIDFKNKIYLGKFERGNFAHSSFFAAGPVKGAGVLFFEKGKLIGIWDDSGHYNSEAPPDVDNLMMRRTLYAFQQKGVNISNVKIWLTELDKKNKMNKIIYKMSSEEFIKSTNPKKVSSENTQNVFSKKRKTEEERLLYLKDLNQTKNQGMK